MQLKPLFSAALCLLLACDSSPNVTLTRDENGVAHIIANDVNGALFGAGYAQHQDRPVQLRLRRLQALGRASQVDISHLENDRLAKAIGFATLAESATDRMRASEPTLYGKLEAWTAGVNRSSSERDETEGTISERWRVEDVVAISKFIHFSAGNTFSLEIFRTLSDQFAPAAEQRFNFDRPLFANTIIPNAPTTQRAAIRLKPSVEQPALDLTATQTRALTRFFKRMPFKKGGHSNAWAIPPSMTNNGRSMLAADPHQAVESPNVFWPHAMHYDDHDIVGFGFAGSPGVQLGFNRHLAWGATTAFADTMDLVEVELSEQAINVDGQTLAFTTREETLEDGSTFTARDIENVGVILPNEIFPIPISNKAVLLRWTGFQHGRTDLSATISLGEKQTAAAFDNALQEMVVSNFNWVFVDASQTHYRASPRIPLRQANIKADRLVDGTLNGSLFPNRFLPIDALPQRRGDALIVAANNDTNGHTLDGDPFNDDFYFGPGLQQGVRAARANAKLTTELATEGSLQALQHDTHSLFADTLLSILEEIWDANACTADCNGPNDIVEELTAWDRKLNADSETATRYQHTIVALTAEVCQDSFGLLYPAITEASFELVVSVTLQDLRARLASGDIDSVRADMLTALRVAAAPPRQPWGNLHRIQFGNDMFPIAGGDDTIFVSPTSGLVTAHATREAAAFQMVASLNADREPEVLVTLAGNASASSPDTFLADWREANYRRFSLTRPTENRRSQQLPLP